MSWPFVNLLFSTERISMSSWESTWCSSFLSGSSSQYEIKGERIWNSLDIFRNFVQFLQFFWLISLEPSNFVKISFSKFWFRRTKWFWGFFFLFEALKTTEHFQIPLFSLPLLPSPIVVIHKVLRFKLTCSVDLIISQAILTSCMLGGGGRVSKDTKRSLKGKSTELMIQNVWMSWRRSMRKISLCYDSLTLPGLGFYTSNLSL